ncbi:hypothetical protein FI667_g8966, partial [Globisporangium splendens]
MTDNEVAMLIKQLINARADLRVKDEQLNSAHALLNRAQADLVIARGDIRLKDEQIERQIERHQAQLERKDEQHQEQLAIKDAHHREHLAIKDAQIQQQHEERVGLLAERTRLHDRFDGHLNNLLNAHQTTLLNAHQATRQHITDQLQGLETRLTRHPNNVKKHHGFAALLTSEGNGKYEHRLIRGQRKHVLKTIESSGPHELLQPFTTAGNGVNLGINFVRVVTGILDQQFGSTRLDPKGEDVWISITGARATLFTMCSKSA